MTRQRTTQHPDWKRSLRGSEGRGLCRRCLTEVPKGRQTFCSEACVDAFKLATGSSGWVREMVRKRDRGICAACSLDTYALRRRLDAKAKAWEVRLGPDGLSRLHARLRTRAGLPPRTLVDAKPDWRTVSAWWLLRLGWPPKVVLQLVRPLSERWQRYRDSSLRSAFWHADHIVPLCEGGEATMENLRTLCVPCHLKETALLAKRRRKGNAKTS